MVKKRKIRERERNMRQRKERKNEIRMTRQCKRNKRKKMERKGESHGWWDKGKGERMWQGWWDNGKEKKERQWKGRERERVEDDETIEKNLADQGDEWWHNANEKKKAKSRLCDKEKEKKKMWGKGDKETN